jgi:thiosulfate/3-mercaptopyruvate sulfurtransferase
LGQRTATRETGNKAGRRCRLDFRPEEETMLTYLLGLKDVCNYDGSWTEYGSLTGAPIEK